MTDDPRNRSRGGDNPSREDEGGGSGFDQGDEPRHPLHEDKSYYGEDESSPVDSPERQSAPKEEPGHDGIVDDL